MIFHLSLWYLFEWGFVRDHIVVKISAYAKFSRIGVLGNCRNFSKPAVLEMGKTDKVEILAQKVTNILLFESPCLLIFLATFFDRKCSSFGYQPSIFSRFSWKCHFLALFRTRFLTFSHFADASFLKH